MDTEKLEQKVRKYAGEDGEEILEAVRELSAVDVKIKNSLQEIERIEDGLPEKHNKLSDKINGLIEKVVEAQGDCDAEGKQKEPEPEPEEKVKTIRIVVKAVPMPMRMGTLRIPLAMMALMDFLNS